MFSICAGQRRRRACAPEHNIKFHLNAGELQLTTIEEAEKKERVRTQQCKGTKREDNEKQSPAESLKRSLLRASRLSTFLCRALASSVHLHFQHHNKMRFPLDLK